LAKFEMAWLQKPHLVSRGAQKCFVEFMLDIDKHKSKQAPDNVAFEQMCAKALLYRSAEKIVGDQKFGGYRANIVAYTLSYIISSLRTPLDLDAIWKQQAIGPELAHAIEHTCTETYKFLVNPPGGANVTEFAKREECWKAFKKLDLPLIDLSSECIRQRSDRLKREANSSDPDSNSNQADLVAWVLEVPSTTWVAIANWARSNDTLAVAQRKAAFRLGLTAGSGKRPSDQLVIEGHGLYQEAVALGWSE